MRKLTVKNFSVIKDAELEFGKITVLIGPQASGKSLLCKLAYFLGKEALEVAVENIVRGKQYDEFRDAINGLFYNRFPTSQELNSSYEVELTQAQYTVRCFGNFEVHDGLRGCTFSREFEKLYSTLQAKYSASGRVESNPILHPEEVIWIELNLLLTDPAVLRSFYIPSGRAFFTNSALGFSLLQNPGIDQITRNFAAQIQWDGRWKIGMLTLGREIPYEITRRMTEIAQGFVITDSGVPRFQTLRGQRNLPLELLSSGTQEIVPIFNVIEQFMFLREHTIAREGAIQEPAQKHRPISGKPLLYLEEPEANVFPKTQYELIQLFGWLAGDPVLDFDWVITTHSPYTLSSFNNLIYAGQLANQKPELKGEIAKMVPERYWIESGTFRAYCIHDGILKSILSESGLIDGEYLDSVSDTIGNEFDSLLRLEYDNTKAS